MDRFDDEIEGLAYKAIGAAIEVHRHLGMGHPELAYSNAFEHELKLRDIPYEREFPYKVYYKEIVVSEGRMDFLVGKRLTVEHKSVEQLIDAHRGRVINYMASLQEPLGLLINYNVRVLRDDGIRRVVQSVFHKQL
jgi:GxxExxY protein